MSSPSHKESSQCAGSSKRIADATDDSIQIDVLEGGESSAPPALQGNDIFVTVRLVSGKKLEIKVNKDNKVGSLFSRIESITRTRMSEYTLIYGGEQLDAEKKIEECGIEQDSIVYVVERFRNIGDREMWSALERMVRSSIRMCNDGYDEVVSHEIKCVMKCFLDEIKKGLHELGIRYLSFFRSLSCEDVLAGLSLSPVKKIEDLGLHVIDNFLNAVQDFDARLRASTVISVLQICNRWRMQDTSGVNYCIYRKVLSYIVLTAVIDPDESLVTWQEIMPYVIEVGKKVTDDLAESLESPTMDIPRLDNVQELYAFLIAIVTSISDYLGTDKPIRMPDGDSNQFYEHLQPLHYLFLQLVEKMDACFRRAELDLSRDNNEDSSLLNAEGFAYFVLIQALSEISNIYEGALESLLRVLEARKLTLRVLVTRYAVRDSSYIASLYGLLELMQVLDFICRKHLANMLFHPVLEFPDPDDTILIDRSALVSQSCMHISQMKPEDLRSGFCIQFRNEEAIGRGVMREWIVLLCSMIFTPRNRMFIFNPTDRRRFYINPASVDFIGVRDLFIIHGKLIALALMYEVKIGVLLDNVLYVQLAGRDVQLEDIKDTDWTTYQSCQDILSMDADMVDADALGLTFSIEYEVLGQRRFMELHDGGANVKVTSKNRKQYVQEMIRHRFQQSTRYQMEHFAKGFGDILLDKEYCRLFFRIVALEDLDSMLGGSFGEISVADWKAHTDYADYSGYADYSDYKDSDPQIIWFWKAVEEMSETERRNLLIFWTAIKFLPVEGFSGIHPRLSIRKAKEGSDKLPVSYTCFSLIYIPEYPTYEVLKQRLAVIVSGKVAWGFGME